MVFDLYHIHGCQSTLIVWIRTAIANMGQTPTSHYSVLKLQGLRQTTVEQSIYTALKGPVLITYRIPKVRGHGYLKTISGKFVKPTLFKK